MNVLFSNKPDNDDRNLNQIFNNWYSQFYFHVHVFCIFIIRITNDFECFIQWLSTKGAIVQCMNVSLAISLFHFTDTSICGHLYEIVRDSGNKNSALGPYKKSQSLRFSMTLPLNCKSEIPIFTLSNLCVCCNQTNLFTIKDFKILML